MRDPIIFILQNVVSGLIVYALTQPRLWRSLIFFRSRRDPRHGKLIFFLFACIAWACLNIFAILYAQGTELQLLTVTTVFLVTSTLLCRFFLKELNKFWHIGILGADIEVKKGIDYKKALNLCQNHLEFLGTGAVKLTSALEFEEALVRCRQDLPIKFLLCKPTEENLIKAAQRAGKHKDEYCYLIRNSLQKIVDIKKQRGLNIQVRFYDGISYFRLMFIDRSICLFSFNIFGEGDGSRLPQLHVVKAGQRKRDSSSFYNPLELYFGELWERATEWDFKSYLENH